ncbi:hypothetical protein [Palleronia caenipelagi]|uniref:Uncharacterized protein n=1 Tax=Palleronia caenipelagi TaxID=2489174 RepID=A0A547QAQ2_9RHOB|nr:hypothetical protein [Palleronia caenipelagi]TRD23459.1 hypothetical protein FEV53_00125 [Palleronia caenipelagi]
MATDPATDQWDLLADLRRGIGLLDPNDAPLDPDDLAVLDDLADGIDRLLGQQMMVGSEDVRSALRKEADFRIAQLAVTIRLCWDERGAALEMIDALLKGKKRVDGVEDLVAWVREIWQKMGGG